MWFTTRAAIPSLFRSIVHWIRSDLTGPRDEKLKILGASDLATTAWTEVRPRAPLYLFLKGDDQKEREYRRGIPLPDIFPVHSLGVITGCDARSVAFEPEAFGDEGPGERFLVRPFDLRSILYRPDRLARPRTAVMGHLRSGDNVALLAARRWPHPGEAPGVLATRWLAGHKVLSRHDPNAVFPLYLLGSGASRSPNLDPRLWNRLSGLYGERPAPEAVFGYVYAVLHSPGYRSRFAGQLHNGFARIPFVQETAAFQQLSSVGAELVRLHLLDHPKLAGAETPDREGIDPQVLACQVGSYRVVERWLKARAGRPLSRVETDTLGRMTKALRLSSEIEQSLTHAPYFFS